MKEMNFFSYIHFSFSQKYVTQEATRVSVLFKFGHVRLFGSAKIPREGPLFQLQKLVKMQLHIFG